MSATLHVLPFDTALFVEFCKNMRKTAQNYCIYLITIQTSCVWRNVLKCARKACLVTWIGFVCAGNWSCFVYDHTIFKVQKNSWNPTWQHVTPGISNHCRWNYHSVITYSCWKQLGIRVLCMICKANLKPVIFWIL